MPTPASGSIRWSRHLPDPLIALGGDGGATLVAASETDLMKLNREGKALWALDIPGEDRTRVFELTASASTGLIHGSSISYPHGGWRPSVWRLNGDGSGYSELDAGIDLQRVGPVTANTASDVAWVVDGAGESRIVVRRSGGRELSINPAPDRLDFQVPGLDDGGHVLAAVYTSEAAQLGATRVEPGLSLMRFKADGAVDWATSLGASAQGTFAKLATTRLGTVVALGRFTGTVVWGTSTFEPSDDHPRDFVLVAEATGAPRFAIQLPKAELSAPTAVMAVDPSGRLAVAWRAPGGRGIVRFYNLEGTPLWERTFTSDVTPTGVAFLGHDVVVAGRFSGSADLGSGQVTATGEDGFLLRLAP